MTDTVKTNDLPAFLRLIPEEFRNPDSPLVVQACIRELAEDPRLLQKPGCSYTTTERAGNLPAWFGATLAGAMCGD